MYNMIYIKRYTAIKIFVQYSISNIIYSERQYVNTVTILFLDLVVKDYQLIEKIQDVFRFSNIIN